jgi:hypothetical protein
MIEKIEVAIFGPSENSDYEVRFRSGFTCKIGAVSCHVVATHIVLDRQDYIGFQFLDAPFDERTAKVMCLVAESVVLGAFAKTGILSESADPMYFMKIFEQSQRSRTSSKATPADDTVS